MTRRTRWWELALMILGALAIIVLLFAYVENHNAAEDVRRLA